ncbi:MAG: exodeoxyribonuclease VII small subunit [Gemmatimonadetes bacterium]|jgi:exodeoxyribonuclease VII small subunit|nr:exodeoxyribonuclease VII small subunit [Gemmatimonadota bacterium]MBK9547766.1 exodeoxyribonuclease VII small subunit [Gemmatimonadota bacterium]MBP6442514.1 exodeoxyribonuclease VII small subunit [Gemmatimonadales bacterium]MBP6569800.1 exodeoxyribonuclease VII small subunit [Gemmatimonadales bacterium]MBP9896747.1 exodeoxyribonuclease VII small subunit [Gemmatimonadales bacterium]
MSDTPTLGQDLARLEEIVRRLEDDDLALEAALQLFEEGVTRLKTAQSRLAVAEARVMQVLQDSEQSGGLRLEPLDG